MRYTILLCLLLCSFSIFSQVLSENQISVIGVSDQDFKFSHLEAYILINKVERNEYQKINAMSISEVLEKLQNEISSIGYDTTDFVEIFPKSHYNNFNSKEYLFQIKTEEEAKSFAEIKLPGFQLRSISYKFENEVDELELTKKAIINAKDKANFIAEQLDKKIGKTVNVNYSNYGNPQVPGNHNQPVYTYFHRITVVFELID